jgi:hypothetical protein
MYLKDFKPLQYGQVRAMEQIEGIELLEEYKQQSSLGDDEHKDGIMIYATKLFLS